MVIYRSNKRNIIDNIPEIIEKNCIINDDIIFLGTDLFHNIDNSLFLLTELNKILSLKNNKVYFVKNYNDDNSLFEEDNKIIQTYSTKGESLLQLNNVKLLKNKQILNNTLILNSLFYKYEEHSSFENIVSYGSPSICNLINDINFRNSEKTIEIEMTINECKELNKLYYNREIKNWLYLSEEDNQYKINETMFKGLVQEKVFYL